jgi:hypothetical protein
MSEVPKNEIPEPLGKSNLMSEPDDEPTLSEESEPDDEPTQA